MTPMQQRVQFGWRRWLATIAVAGLLLEAGTGIWTYFFAFSVTSQVIVILHVVAGLALAIPIAVYLVSHLKAWSDQRSNATAIIGYGTALVTLVAIVSGLITAFQAGWATRVNDDLAFIHLITGLALAPVLLIHMWAAIRRRAHAFKADAAMRAARGLLFRRTFALLAGAALVLIALTLTVTPNQVWREVPADYEYAENYGDGAGLFAPSYARTASGGMIEPQVLARSESCGTSGCHSQILAEWQPSAHRFSAMNPPFQAVQKMFLEDRSAAQTRYCAGCHDPISLFAGAKSAEAADLSAPGFQEGTSCVACHSIEAVDRRGNGDYVLTAPVPYLWEDQSGLRRWLAEFLIRSYPRKHRDDYDRSVARTPEYCGSCHKQFIPEELNRFGMSPGQNQFDEWAQSHWHSDNPDTDLNCTDCHMRLVVDSQDPGRGETSDPQRGDDGAHRHHGFIATNSFMPDLLKLPHYQEQIALTEAWLRGETVIPEISNRWPEGPVVGLDIQTPDEVTAGGDLRFSVSVHNRKAGHNLTTGPLDFVRTWLWVQVRDSKGSLLDEWGALHPETRAIMDHGDIPHKPGNPRDQGTLVLEAQPLDEHGQALTRHELWRKAGGEAQRVVFPGYSDRQIYQTKLDPGVAGPLNIRAELRFRRYRQEFLDLVLPDLEETTGVYQPAVLQNVVEATVPLATDQPSGSAP